MMIALLRIQSQVTAEQRPIADTQIKRKESKHTTAENHQVTRNRAREEERDKGVQQSRVLMAQPVLGASQVLRPGAGICG